MLFFILILIIIISKLFRFLEINCKEVRNYRNIHSRVLECIETICKTVNQTLLLESLHDVRFCDPLLEPETNDDIWNSNQMAMDRTKSYEGKEY